MQINADPEYVQTLPSHLDFVMKNILKPLGKAENQVYLLITESFPRSWIRIPIPNTGPNPDLDLGEPKLLRIPDLQDCVKLVGVLTLSCSPSGSRASGAAPCGPSPALTCPLGLERVQNLRTKNTYILIFNKEGENSAIPPSNK
jgi:hypothetical protein